MFFNDRDTIHDVARLTNTTLPLVNYITSKKYPLQDKTKLKTEIVISVRSRFNAEILHRPILDSAAVYVLRYDVDEPHITIGLGLDKNYKGCIFVFKNNVEGDFVAIYPEQKYNYLLRYTNDVFMDYKFLEDAILGRTIRCDESEPAFAVVSEVVNNKVRFILADEAICMTNHASTEIYHTETEVYDFLEEELGDYDIDDGTGEESTSHRLNSQNYRR